VSWLPDPRAALFSLVVSSCLPQEYAHTINEALDCSAVQRFVAGLRN
jgi:hypothetical protein